MHHYTEVRPGAGVGIENQSADRLPVPDATGVLTAASEQLFNDATWMVGMRNRI